MNLWEIVTTIGGVILLFVILIGFIIWWYYSTFQSEIINYCEHIPEYRYRENVYVPQRNGIYEKKLAVALLDISLNVTKSNCDRGVLPILPPTLPETVTLLECHIFFNKQTRMAVIAFSGSFYLTEWFIDVKYDQVPATSLNNYIPGVQCHRGFYNRYLEMRDFIWSWWNQNLLFIDNLFITGHSLGGALSTICAFDFAHINTPVTSMNNNMMLNNNMLTTNNITSNNITDEVIYFNMMNNSNITEQDYLRMLYDSGNITEFDYLRMLYDMGNISELDYYNNLNNQNNLFGVNKQLIHYSFAAPRSGNVEYANHFKVIMHDTSLRVNNTEDAIPQLPPASIRGWIYKHTDRNIPFTVSLGSLADDHIQAYQCCMPDT